MRRRICLVVGLVALAAPASGWAQSSSQAQYQGVAPETQLPVTGGGGGANGAGGGAVTNGGRAATNGSGGGGAASGSGAKATGGSGAAANGATGSGGATAAQQTPALSLPTPSSSTSPFGGGDILWIVLAAAGLTLIGLLLRRTTHRAHAA